MNNHPFSPWDHHSDQPHVIRDKKLKRKLYRLGAIESLKTLLISLAALPAAWLIKQFSRTATLPASAYDIGLCINIESTLPEKSVVANDKLAELTDELAATHLLVRLPLSDTGNLQPYIGLCESLGKRHFLFDILQDRLHIEDHTLLENNLRNLFATFQSYGSTFKIGNAINRRKWGFVSQLEYFRFFKIAQNLRDREFPELKLLGGSIIDFELPNFARSLLHCTRAKYDGVAALLYVDRRGAPENTQLGANLQGKISWFRAIMKLSNKTTQQLYITETNWPLIGTEPFAPAVGDCMVDENQQAAYLARYYLLAMATGQVNAIYWHQLVAPGYGLIDNRGSEMRKRRAFYAFKTLNQLFADSRIISFSTQGSLWIIEAEKDLKKITAIWTNDEDISISIDNLKILNASASPESIQIFDLTGNTLDSESTLTLSAAATYFVQHFDRPIAHVSATHSPATHGSTEQASYKTNKPEVEQP